MERTRSNSRTFADTFPKGRTRRRPQATHNHYYRLTDEEHRLIQREASRRGIPQTHLIEELLLPQIHRLAKRHPR